MDITTTPEWKKYESRMRKNALRLILQSNHELRGLESGANSNPEREKALKEIVSVLFKNEVEHIEKKRHSRVIGIVADMRVIDQVREIEPDFNISEFFRTQIDIYLSVIQAKSVAQGLSEEVPVGVEPAQHGVESWPED